MEDRLIKTEELCHLVGMSSVTVWRILRDKKDVSFPKPIIRSSRTKYYSYKETMEWIEMQKKSREPENDSPLI